MPFKTKTKLYRADIDGLRAVAILAVLVFHLDPLLLPGGFVGVDVFLVISGYLITLSILKSEASHRFSLGAFFIRRFWRLYPALLATVGATSVAAYYLLPPDAFLEFGRSVLSGLGAVSNIQFWLESGYFDSEAQTKALLHTWSLSVEWQFYVFWSVFLFLFFRYLRRRSPLVLWVVGFFLLSLASSVWWLAQGKLTAAFFLSPLRVFEFMLGAVLVLLPKAEQPPNRWFAALILVLSYSAIAYASYMFSAADGFPGWRALLPALGAMGVIYAGQSSLLAAPLRWRPVVIVGLISYSVYLVHWPLIVLTRYYFFEPLQPSQLVMLALTSLGLGAVLYRWVEAPFRSYYKTPFSLSRRLGRWSWPAALVVLLGFGGAVSASQGWVWRLPAELQVGMSGLMDQQAQYWTAAFGQKSGFTTNKKHVYVIGNSFAADVYYALEKNTDLEVALDGTTSNLCYGLSASIPHYPAFACEDNFLELAHTDNAKQADIIVIQELWSLRVSTEQYAKQLTYAIGVLREVNPKAQLVIMGPRAMFKYSVPQLLFKHGQLAGANASLAAYMDPAYAALVSFDNFLGQYAAQHHAHYISLLDLLCEDQLCAAIGPDGRPLYWDAGHFSWAGAELLHQKMQEAGSYGVFE